MVSYDKVTVRTLLDLVEVLDLVSRVKLQPLPGSRCDGLRTVLEQYFRHAWFFRHAVLQACRGGLSSGYVAPAVGGGRGGRRGVEAWRGGQHGFLPGQGSAAFCGGDHRRLLLGLDRVRQRFVSSCWPLRAFAQFFSAWSVERDIAIPFSSCQKQQQYNLERIRFNWRRASTALWGVEA